jgi:TolB-like protein
MRRDKLIIFFILMLLGTSIISGCASGYKPKNHSPFVIRGNLVGSGYTIADRLITNLKQPINREDPIIVATFVSVDDLEESSTFGRLITEQISSRLSQKGYKVNEIKFRKNSIFMEKGKGEFLLSRDLHNVSKKHNASAVVVGTYGEAYNAIYVSARIINPSNTSIVSSCDYAVQLSNRSQAILTRNDKKN